jgi:ribosomal protein L22
MAEDPKDPVEETETEAAEEAKPKPKAKAKSKAKPKAKAKAKPAKAAPEEPKAEEPVAEGDEAGTVPAEADSAGESQTADAVADSSDAAKPKAKAKGEPKAKGKSKAKAESSRRRQAAEPGVLVRAQAKYVRTSARKARLVCDHIRGKDVAEARAILAYTPRAAAKAWIKLLESAVANAEHNHELVGEDLRIAAVHADEGPTLKRYRPRAMGRATRIRKRTSHLTITLTPKES